MRSMLKIDNEKCNACGLCEKSCPFDAIAVKDEVAQANDWDTLVPKAVAEVLESAGLDFGDIDMLIMHQANRRIIDAVWSEYPSLDLQVHIHDTRNMGMVNTLAAIECGVDKVQSTLGGLGGCPFAPGASGNLATEDIVHMLNEMGIKTGVETAEMVAAARRSLEHRLDHEDRPDDPEDEPAHHEDLVAALAIEVADRVLGVGGEHDPAYLALIAVDTRLAEVFGDRDVGRELTPPLRNLRALQLEHDRTVEFA